MNTLKAYEPRAAIIGVDIRALSDGVTIVITIVFNVINKEEPVTLNITLERVR
jgi:phage baseplate assembly protein W